MKTIYLPCNSVLKEAKKRTLIVTSLDYSKAFNSIKRETLIETLIHYKVHYKIIEVVANIYKDDYTEIQFGDIEKKMA